MIRHQYPFIRYIVDGLQLKHLAPAGHIYSTLVVSYDKFEHGELEHAKRYYFRVVETTYK
jgi:hypothetical protein